MAEFVNTILDKHSFTALVDYISLVTFYHRLLRKLHFGWALGARGQLKFSIMSVIKKIQNLNKHHAKNGISIFNELKVTCSVQKEQISLIG